MEETRKRRVLLGVTGGIAAYKVAELARALIRNNVEVQVAMTEAGTKFVTPATFQALTGKPVVTDLWDASFPNAMAHIELSRGADAIVIAPASADFIAKLAHGLADDLLSTACLARNCPLLVAPAMNREMWDNPATQRNVNLLRADGVGDPRPRRAATRPAGKSAWGGSSSPRSCCRRILAFLAPKRLAGRKVLVTAGPTFEAIDTVRGITNLSSGKMGYAIAEAAAALGADVTLVSGPTVARAARERALRLRDQRRGDAQRGERARVVAPISSSASPRWRTTRPRRRLGRKIKKSGEPLEIKLQAHRGHPRARGEDARRARSAWASPPRARTSREYAQAKRERKNIPMIVANLVQHAVGREENEVTIYDDAGAHAARAGPEVAHRARDPRARARALRREARRRDGHADQAGFLISPTTSLPPRRRSIGRR